MIKYRLRTKTELKTKMKTQTYKVQLNDEQRKRLKDLVTRGKALAYKIRRANILLKADISGPAWKDHEIADSFNVTVTTVAATRRRFFEQGLEGALNRKPQDRPSRTHALDGEGQARLIAMRCGAPPDGYARWTLRLLADKMVEANYQISYETVRQELKKMNLGRISKRCG